MTPETLATVADGLTIVGLAILTLAVVGMVRFPDVYMQSHASSLGVGLGIVAILAATAMTGTAATAARALLVAGLLFLTGPVSVHVIGWAAHRNREPMRAGGAVDESGQ